MRAVILSTLLLVSGCSKGFSYNPYSTEKYSPRQPANQVQVLFDNPQQSYKVIGFLDYDFYHPGWASPTISEALPSLKEKVHAVGGDGVIVRSQVAGLGWERNLRIVGDVIRYDP